MDREFAVETNGQLEPLLESAAHGERVVITRGGKPVATLLPAPARDVGKARAAADRILGNPPIDPDGMTISELINEGRRY